MPLLLILAGTLAYLNTLPNAFVFDDEPAILLNEQIRDLAGVRTILLGSGESGGSNRPVTELTLALNYALGGGEPAGYHLFNMVIHIFAALALFGLVRRTLELPTFSDRFRKQASWIGSAVALLWLLHPLNTQAVTYTIQRGESLAGLCYLFTLYSFVRYAGGGSKAWAALSVAVCLIGMGCKEVMATAPLVVLLYDYCLVGRSWKDLLTKRWKLYVGLFAAWVPMGWIVYRTLSGDAESVGGALDDKLLSRWTYLLTQPGVIVEVYLRKALWPSPLILDYQWRPAIPQDTPSSEVARLFMANVLWQGLVLVGLLGASVWGVIKKTWWGFLGLSFFLVLGPTSSLMPIADLAVEHRMYLPLIAVIGVVVAGGYALLRYAVPDKPEAYGLTIVAACALSLGLMTFNRNMEYRSRVSIWGTVAERRPSNSRGWYNLASALQREGEDKLAMRAYGEVLAINHDHAGAHNGVGNIWLDQGQTDQAIVELETAVELKPDSPVYHRELGRALLVDDQLDRAREHLEKAVALDPLFAKAYDDLGIVHARLNDPQRALEHFLKATQLAPAELGFWLNLATTYEVLGRFRDAGECLDRGLASSLEAESGPAGVSDPAAADPLLRRQVIQRRDAYRAQADQAPDGP